MNWFTREHFKTASSLDEGIDLCEHLKVTPDQPTLVVYEKDSFGIVGGMAFCKSCKETEENKEAEKEQCCYDCKELVKEKDGMWWTPYDYLPLQGDVPTFVCDSCQSLPKHVKRLDDDAYYCSQEFGDDDDY